MSKKASKKSGKSRSARPKPTQRKTVLTPPSPPTKMAGTTLAKPLTSSRKRRSGTKLARVIAMLRARGGTTIVAMMQATGWQQHSVRGFLAGVVHKKLGLNLMSEPGESGRVYRIDDRKVDATINKAD